MAYPQATLNTLEALYRLGVEVCDEIEKFQPDVVIGLAHSGWMPVVVAQTLWAEIEKNPFPPSMRTNIGLEKYDLYVERYGKSPPAFCCGECCDGTVRKSHYLAWMAEQSPWLKTLQKQIKSVFPSTPKRILVVDDIFGGYRSGYATLTMLQALYPNVDAYVHAGHNDLTDNFVTGWLEQFVPELAKDILKAQENSTYQNRYSSPWHEKLKPLITGTEDITPDSLDWKFLSCESMAVKELAGYVPADVALSAPEWAKTLACTYALQRLNGEIKDDEAVDPGEDMDHLFPISHLSLYPEERLAARSWRQGGVTNADIAQIYGDTPEGMKKGLGDVNGKFAWHVHGGLYFAADSFDSWINAYFPPERVKPDTSVQGFAEFLPGEVWAGAYPLSNAGMDAELFKHLLSLGVNNFIDLTNPEDFHRKLSYRNTLQQASREIGRKVDVEFFPLPFGDSPAPLQVQQILKHITRSLKKGQRIYIHAGYNLEGRTPLILACLLIQRGASTEKALTKVNAFWAKTLHFLVRSPLSEEQRQFILNWKREG